MPIGHRATFDKTTLLREAQIATPRDAGNGPL
jgi:hypothetical protein